MKNNLVNAQDVFLDKINTICNKFGLNNIMAQLYAILYLSDKPLSLNDMVGRLKISKGSASINIRALERYGVVRKVWVRGSGSRKDYYEAEGDISKVILERVRSMAHSRLVEVDDMIGASRAALNSVDCDGGEDEESIKIFRERLEKVKSFYDQARSLFDLFNTALANNELISAKRIENQ